jgi:peptide/nickel transport system permease protein
MAHAVLRRIGGAICVMFVVASLAFVVIRLAPGDPAALMLGPEASTAQVEALRARLGLDAPLWRQYLDYLGAAVRGDLGTSIFLGRPVVQALAERVEPTLCLTLMAIALAMAIGLPAGSVAAMHRGKGLDQVVLTAAMLAASLPAFWLALMLIRRFAVGLHWFPASGYGPPDASFADRMRCLLLPAVVLGLNNSALVTRFTRASMLDVLGEDFVRTARAKGVRESGVLLRHVLRPGLVPVLTVIGLSMALLLGGAVVVEAVFGLPGVGSLVVSAVLRRDYPVIQGALLAIAGIYVLVNLAVDLLYLAADPRLRA